MSDWQTCTGFPVVFHAGAAWCVRGAYFSCVEQFLAESWQDVNAAIRRGDLVPVLPPGAQKEKQQRTYAIKANKQRSETRAWLEAHGWRFMGFNPRHRTAYYANLNLNTVQTFPQWQAEEITRRVMFGVKVGQDMGLLFNQLGIMTPVDYSIPALQRRMRAMFSLIGPLAVRLEMGTLWSVVWTIMQCRKMTRTVLTDEAAKL